MITVSFIGCVNISDDLMARTSGDSSSVCSNVCSSSSHKTVFASRNDLSGERKNCSVWTCMPPIIHAKHQSSSVQEIPLALGPDFGQPSLTTLIVTIN